MYSLHLMNIYCNVCLVSPNYDFPLASVCLLNACSVCSTTEYCILTFRVYILYDSTFLHWKLLFGVLVFDIHLHMKLVSSVQFILKTCMLCTFLDWKLLLTLKSHTECDNSLLLQVDQDVERVVSRDEGERWAKSHKLTYWETSAATGVGVFSMFHSLLQDVVEKMKEPQNDMYSDGEMEKWGEHFTRFR